MFGEQKFLKNSKYFLVYTALVSTACSEFPSMQKNVAPQEESFELELIIAVVVVASLFQQADSIPRHLVPETRRSLWCHQRLPRCEGQNVGHALHETAPEMCKGPSDSHTWNPSERLPYTVTEWVDSRERKVTYKTDSILLRIHSFVSNIEELFPFCFPTHLCSIYNTISIGPVHFIVTFFKNLLHWRYHVSGKDNG